MSAPFHSDTWFQAELWSGHDLVFIHCLKNSFSLSDANTTSSNLQCSYKIRFLHVKRKGLSGDDIRQERFQNRAASNNYFPSVGYVLFFLLQTRISVPQSSKSSLWTNRKRNIFA